MPTHIGIFEDQCVALIHADRLIGPMQPAGNSYGKRAIQPFVMESDTNPGQMRWNSIRDALNFSGKELHFRRRVRGAVVASNALKDARCEQHQQWNGASERRRKAMAYVKHEAI